VKRTIVRSLFIFGMCLPIVGSAVVTLEARQTQSLTMGMATTAGLPMEPGATTARITARVFDYDAVSKTLNYVGPPVTFDIPLTSAQILTLPSAPAASGMERGVQVINHRNEGPDPRASCFLAVTSSTGSFIRSAVRITRVPDLELGGWKRACFGEPRFEF
jgi:hypothetical protein